MYPTMEMLLRHSIQYLHLRGKAAVSEPGNLDNEDLLLEYMKKQQDGGKLNDEERVVAMSAFLLACIMDGDMGATQMELWARLVSTSRALLHGPFASRCTEMTAAQCNVASDIAVFDENRVQWLCSRFRAFECLTAADVHDVFDPNGTGVEVPASARRDYYMCVHSCMPRTRCIQRLKAEVLG